jgi:hypothetical protein
MGAPVLFAFGRVVFRAARLKLERERELFGKPEQDDESRGATAAVTKDVPSASTTRDGIRDMVASALEMKKFEAGCVPMFNSEILRDNKPKEDLDCLYKCSELRWTVTESYLYMMYGHRRPTTLPLFRLDYHDLGAEAA